METTSSANKKGAKMGNAYTNAILTVLALAVVGGFGWFVYNQSMQPEVQQQTTQTIIQESKTGNIISFKLSSQDNSDNPTRYAGTAYCWDTSSPTQLKGGGSITLSATTSTSVPSVTKGNPFKCVAFDSSHYGKIADFNIDKESDDKLIDTLNASNLNTVTIWEDGTKDDPASLGVPAGNDDQFNKWSYKANIADAGFNLKEVCFSSNASSVSEITNIELDGGWTKVSSVPYRYRNTHKYCHILPTAQYIEDKNEVEFGKIRVYASSDFVSLEEMNMTIIDEAYFKSVTGAILLGIENDDASPADTGASDGSVLFNVTVG